jgi:penicillin-binding protein-related factor A (putative recombinase)
VTAANANVSVSIKASYYIKSRMASVDRVALNTPVGTPIGKQKSTLDPNRVFKLKFIDFERS